jgi:hypothetical protein
MLVLTGRWRTIAAAAATIVVLAATTAIAFGPQLWTAYVNDAMPVQSRVFLRDFEHFMVHMPTAFMNMRIAGFSLMTAAIMQAVLSAITLAAVTWTFWRRRDHDLSNILLVTASFVVTPCRATRLAYLELGTQDGRRELLARDLHCHRQWNSVVWLHGRLSLARS